MTLLLKTSVLVKHETKLTVVFSFTFNKSLRQSYKKMSDHFFFLKKKMALNFFPFKELIIIENIWGRQISPFSIHVKSKTKKAWVDMFLEKKINNFQVVYLCYSWTFHPWFHLFAVYENSLSWSYFFDRIKRKIQLKNDSCHTVIPCYSQLHYSWYFNKTHI